MKALIIAAHGSRKKEPAREVAALAENMARKAGKEFDMVAHAFLQFCDPKLDTVIAQTAEKGATEIIIFPFFISAGSHVSTDIPESVASAQKKYPAVRFCVTRHLGTIESVEDLILNAVINRPESQ